MRIFVAVVSILIGASGCQTPDIYGSGPIELSDHVKTHYKKYLSKEFPEIFAVTEDGNRSYFTSCPSVHCTSDKFRAVSRCEERVGRKCLIFAENGEIVWKGYTADTREETYASVALNDFHATPTVTFLSRIFYPANQGTFRTRIKKGGPTCAGEYALDGSLKVSLKCENGTYSGVASGFSWQRGGKLDLKGNGRLFEVVIHPFSGKTY